MFKNSDQQVKEPNSSPKINLKFIIDLTIAFLLKRKVELPKIRPQEPPKTIAKI